MDLARHLVISFLLLVTIVVSGALDHADQGGVVADRRCLIVEVPGATARLLCSSSHRDLEVAARDLVRRRLGCAEAQMLDGYEVSRLMTVAVDEQCAVELRPAAERYRFTLGRRLEINRAGESELRLLPGIGPRRAEAIMRLRRRRGPFRDLEQLEDVRGIGPKTVARLRPFVHLVPADAGSSSAN